MSTRERIDYLVDKLNKWTLSYDLGNPEISDKEWDNFYFELLELERQNPELIRSDSPTQSIYSAKITKLNKVTHCEPPMRSLAKTKDIQEVYDYFSDVTEKDIVCSYKLDGLSCRLTYEDGRLIRAETRGNGEVGEDITHNALVIDNIPKQIDRTQLTIVDGEIICTLSNFKPFSQSYKNPRNFAAGSIRLLDAAECKKRNLSFIAWKWVNTNYNSFTASLIALDTFGFNVVPYFSVYNKDKSDEFINIMRNNVKQSDYPIDGLVFTYDDIELGKSKGFTVHHANDSLAFKFYDESEISTLLNIEWSMGKTGVLTPVAIFAPIELEGTEVSRASLHNLNIMNDLCPNGWYKGAKVEVIKSNQIIPQIINVELPNLIDSDVTLEPPVLCPICGYPTSIENTNNSLVLKCNNPKCEGKFLNQLNHFCGKKGLDIKGLSTATLEKLIDWKWVNNFTDIFNLSNYRSEWVKKSGFGVASVDKILAAIEEKKNNCDLASFISSLSISLIGSTYAKKLAEEFNTWNNFYNSVINKFDFTSLDGFGEEMNSSILNFDYTIAEKLSQIITINEYADKKKDNRCDGLTFVITGKLGHHYKNRDELKKIIENAGGKVTSAVSSKTNYLINNDINSNSEKNVTAQRLNVPILTEDEFFNLFN